jgi:hypothetical protein
LPGRKLVMTLVYVLFTGVILFRFHASIPRWAAAAAPVGFGVASSGAASGHQTGFARKGDRFECVKQIRAAGVHGEHP